MNKENVSESKDWNDLMDDDLSQDEMNQADLIASRVHLQNLNLNPIQTVNVSSENAVLPTASSSNNTRHENNEPVVVNVMNRTAVASTSTASNNNNPHYAQRNEPFVVNLGVVNLGLTPIERQWKEEFDNVFQILSNAANHELRQLNVIAQNGRMDISTILHWRNKAEFILGNERYKKEGVASHNNRILMRSFINALEHVPLFKSMEQVQQEKEARAAINKKRRLE